MKKILVLFIIIFISALLFSVLLGYVKVEYKEEIDKTAEEYDLDKNLVYALIMTESNFKADAISSKGASGLMQIMDDTALWCAKRLGDEALAANLTVPAVNIKIGCYYLDYLLDKYNGEESAALAAYNAGSGNVDEWLSDKTYSPDGKSLVGAPYPETDRYIEKIGFYKKLYTLLYGE